MVTTKKQKRENWLEDKTRVYQHGWEECEKGLPYKEFMYPEIGEQEQYKTGWGECHVVMECEVT